MTKTPRDAAHEVLHRSGNSKKDKVARGESLTNISIQKPNKSLIRDLKTLLEYAETGEMIGISYIMQWHGYSVSSGQVGLQTDHIRTIIGEIEIQKQGFIKDQI